jgi:hypothetical protein
LDTVVDLLIVKPDAVVPLRSCDVRTWKDVRGRNSGSCDGCKAPLIINKDVFLNMPGLLRVGEDMDFGFGLAEQDSSCDRSTELGIVNTHR